MYRTGFFYILLLFIGLFLVSCSEETAGPQTLPADWRWQGPITEGKTTWEVWATSPTNVVVVGQDGMILLFDGTAWSFMTSGTGETLRGIWGTASNNLYAVGDGGTILHFDGAAWSEETSPVVSDLHAVWGFSANSVFAVGVFGIILHYDGSTWTEMTSNSTATFYGVWGAAANDVFVAGTSGVHHYDGSTWADMTGVGGTGSLRDVWGASGTQVFAVSLTGSIIHFDGSQWTSVFQATNILWGLHGTSANDVFAVGFGGRIYHYDGSWSDRSIMSSDNFHGVWAGGSGAIAVGSRGVISQFDGSRWVSPIEGETTSLYGLWGGSNQDIFAVGDFGKILRFDGTRWTAMTSGTTESLYGIHGYVLVPVPATGSQRGAGGGSVFQIAVGDNGTVLHNDGRNIWTDISPGGPHLRGVWVADRASEVWVVGHMGTVHRYDGSWTTVPTDTLGTTKELEGVFGVGSEVFVVGRDGTLLHYNGTSWRKIKSPNPNYWYRDVWGMSADDIFVVGEGLSTLPPPGYGDQRHGGGIVLHYDGSNFAQQAFGAIQQDLLDAWGSSGDHVFAVGDVGTMWFHDGDTWTETHSTGVLTPNDIQSIWGFGPEDVFAVGQSGAIFRYSRE